MKAIPVRWVAILHESFHTNLCTRSVNPSCEEARHRDELTREGPTPKSFPSSGRTNVKVDQTLSQLFLGPSVMKSLESDNNFISMHTETTRPFSFGLVSESVICCGMHYSCYMEEKLKLLAVGRRKFLFPSRKSSRQSFKVHSFCRHSNGISRRVVCMAVSSKRDISA